MFEINFYQKSNNKLFYSVGKADLNKTITEESFNKVRKTLLEREEIIINKIGEDNVKNIAARKGDKWVSSMKEFHKTIQADGKPTILSDSEYDAIKTPTLYRGIAPQSRLRRDITTTQTTKEMANEFFNCDSPFPSRGIYGDGIAYASPAYKEIAWKYATDNCKEMHGGVIIEFKLKNDAKTIDYEDALAIFKKLESGGHSNLLFKANQINSRKGEVGKAMNALGYDAIIKHNGDDTGQDFYVILNRGALVAKKKYITKSL